MCIRDSFTYFVGGLFLRFLSRSDTRSQEKTKPWLRLPPEHLSGRSMSPLNEMCEVPLIGDEAVSQSRERQRAARRRKWWSRRMKKKEGSEMGVFVVCQRRWSKKKGKKMTRARKKNFFAFFSSQLSHTQKTLRLGRKNAARVAARGGKFEHFL